MARRFALVREASDAVNPPGVVAEGVLFESGRVALAWCTPPHSTQLFDTMNDLLLIQHKNHTTHVQWVDSDQERGQVHPRSSGVSALRTIQHELKVYLEGTTDTGAEVLTPLGRVSGHP